MTYKILIILTRAFDPNAGGVQRSTYKIASYCKSRGHDTHVFAFSKVSDTAQDVAKLHLVNKGGGAANKENLVHLQNLLKDIKPDIVINQMPYEEALGEALAEVHRLQKFLLLGCLRNTLYTVKENLDAYANSTLPKFLKPAFSSSLGHNILLKAHNSRHVRYLKFILDTYDYFVMFGPPNLKELKYFVGDYKLEKTHLIPNSILDVLPEVPPKENRILWLSRLDYKQKRADLILPFWKKVMHELPDWQFDIVGGGEAFDDLKSQIENEGIPRVKMYGKQVPYEYYKRSPIYIMTSAFEGFPNTLVEAQSFGCAPVVFDNYPICSWLLKEGKAGILIPPLKVDKMAMEVIKLAKDQKRMASLMQLALENAAEFHLDNVGKQWIDFFNRELVNKKIKN